MQLRDIQDWGQHIHSTSPHIEHPLNHTNRTLTGLITRTIILTPGLGILYCVHDKSEGRGTVTKEITLVWECNKMVCSLWKRAKYKTFMDS